MNSDEIITKAQQAKQTLATVDSKTRNTFLTELARILTDQRQPVLDANMADVESARNDRDDAFIDRMTLNDQRYEAMIESVLEVSKQDDIIGKMFDEKIQASGITTAKMHIPLGVILMIYESRPNVTIDAASLALKSGNVIILKGGSETKRTNEALEKIIKAALDEASLPEGCIQVLTEDTRKITSELLGRRGDIDLVIPRGSKRLLKYVDDTSSIPTLLHLEGNCHMYIDKEVDASMAVKLVLNAKTQRLGTCNTLESLLIHSDSVDLLPEIITSLTKKSIEIRGDKSVQALDSRVKAATKDDWSCEYLDAIISVKVVESLDEAIAHINTYGSGHTDAIITNDQDAADEFIRRVDSASVLHNTSTRFADGYEYGLGAEIGISTGKLHARGPVGVEGLTTYKWVVSSDGVSRN